MKLLQNNKVYKRDIPYNPMINQDTQTQNLKVVIEEIKIILKKYSYDYDLKQRLNNSISLLKKWY